MDSAWCTLIGWVSISGPFTLVSRFGFLGWANYISTSVASSLIPSLNRRIIFSILLLTCSVRLAPLPVDMPAWCFCSVLGPAFFSFRSPCRYPYPSLSAHHHFSSPCALPGHLFYTTSGMFQALGRFSDIVLCGCRLKVVVGPLLHIFALLGLI